METPPVKVSREMRSLLESAKQSEIISRFMNGATSKRSRKKPPEQSGRGAEQTPRRPARRASLNAPRRASSEDSGPRRCRSESPYQTGRYSNKRCNGKDSHCWYCHDPEVGLSCFICPRSFHNRCLVKKSMVANFRVCPLCAMAMSAKNIKNKNCRIKKLSVRELSTLLGFAVRNMMCIKGVSVDCLPLTGSRNVKSIEFQVEPFLKPANDVELPLYFDFIVNPMSFLKLQENISRNMYHSMEAFAADVQWIYHNSVIYNGFTAPVTIVAKNIINRCKNEMKAMQNCPDCYQSLFTHGNAWFTQVCNPPHILLWAKCKGCPYWPAKAMYANSGNVLVLFFGKHERNWVPIEDCYLYSQKDPNVNNKLKSAFQASYQELMAHINNVEKKYGIFQPADFKTPYDPADEQMQLSRMIPGLEIESSENDDIDDKSISLTEQNMQSNCIRKMQPKVMLERTINLDFPPISRSSMQEILGVVDFDDVNKSIIGDDFSSLEKSCSNIETPESSYINGTDAPNKRLHSSDDDDDDGVSPPKKLLRNLNARDRKALSMSELMSIQKEYMAALECRPRNSTTITNNVSESDTIQNSEISPKHNKRKTILNPQMLEKIKLDNFQSTPTETLNCVIEPEENNIEESNTSNLCLDESAINTMQSEDVNEESNLTAWKNLKCKANEFLDSFIEKATHNSLDVRVIESTNKLFTGMFSFLNDVITLNENITSSCREEVANLKNEIKSLERQKEIELTEERHINELILSEMRLNYELELERNRSLSHVHSQRLKEFKRKYNDARSNSKIVWKDLSIDDTTKTEKTEQSCTEHKENHNVLIT